MGVHGSCPRSVPTLGSETVQIASTRSCLPSFAVNQIVATLAALSADMGLIVLTKETDAVNADVQKKRGWLQAASAGVLAMVLIRNGTPAMTWQMVFSRLTGSSGAHRSSETGRDRCIFRFLSSPGTKQSHRF